MIGLQFPLSTVFFSYFPTCSLTIPKNTVTWSKSVYTSLGTKKFFFKRGNTSMVFQFYNKI